MSVTITPEIRVATPEDLYSVQECARAFYASSEHLKVFMIERFYSMWERLLESKMAVLYIAVADGRTVGVIGGLKHLDIYSAALVATEMFWFVLPEWRGFGIRLYQAFEDWARAEKCDEIRMVRLVDLMPEKLDIVYRRLGFHQTEVQYAKEIKCAA